MAHNKRNLSGSFNPIAVVGPAARCLFQLVLTYKRPHPPPPFPGSCDLLGVLLPVWQPLCSRGGPHVDCPSRRSRIRWFCLLFAVINAWGRCQRCIN
ncbi:hypothetical protein SLEP1_g59046 [Rubroshorea leprosula]|uniref:Uncharacterized protein n=1 Tax=Rubroshorea leprosula TaxID=152421 RepID=A0AAV5MSE7_9ROSI|nr:hypothetical protein SLEP1_g59046 [Rubroshorea leprosula]